MKPFTKWTLEEHKRELEEIKARNIPEIARIDQQRMTHKWELQKLYKEKQALKQEILNKENYIKSLEKSV